MPRCPKPGRLPPRVLDTRRHQNTIWLAVAFAVRGLKEFGEPARKALIIAQAPPDVRARTYGAYYLIRDCVVTTGSFAGAWRTNDDLKME